MKHLSLDLSGLTEATLGAAGIGHDEFEAMAQAANDSFEDNRARHKAGEIGFWDLPDDKELARSVMKYARELPDEIDTLVVLGIGGSSLGPHALYSALGHPFDTLRPRSSGMPRRVFFSDNPDPQSFAALLDLVPLEKTLFNVVTKSGGTAETAAQLLIVADRIETQLGADALARHLVVTTDPDHGALRREATKLGLTCFPVPNNVGGRFSVLSAVGLLPAAIAGLDVMGLLDGAREVRDAVFGPQGSGSISKNAALALASLLHAHDTQKGRPMVVLMPYADALYNCAEWFRQLWAESLGKAKTRSGEPCNVGPTPIASRGATDQHSQLQLYAEGPDDKSYLFLTLADRGRDMTISKGRLGEAPEFGYLSGHGLGELLDAELLGTRSSLSRRARPNALLTLDRLDAPRVGAYLMLMQAATAFAGPLYDVDAFDQPGVEEAKNLAYAALGRDGFEELASQLDAGRDSDPRYCY